MACNLNFSKKNTAEKKKQKLGSHRDRESGEKKWEKQKSGKNDWKVNWESFETLLVSLIENKVTHRQKSKTFKLNRI